MSKMLKVVGASWFRTQVSSYVLGLLAVLAILALFFGEMERVEEDGNYAATVFYSDKTGYSIEYWGQSNDLKTIPKGVARAYFRMDMKTAGWSLLEVETDGSYPDEVQAYAAGIVEGALTWYLIHTHLENTIRAKCEDRPLEKQCDKLRDALDKSANIWKNHALERSATDPFWHHVSLYYTQISGIYTGWKHGVDRSNNEYETDISDLYWLNMQSEVMEIQHKLNITVEDDILAKIPGISSAFVRLANETSTDGNSTTKMYIAHNSAGSYSSMTRIIKRYILNYHLTTSSSKAAPGKTVQFCGHPGAVGGEDMYLVSGEHNRLAVVGTPLIIYNDKLWKEINITKEVPAGPRITAANRLATNVSSWGHIVARSNSGTNCKQWLIIDMGKLEGVYEGSAESTGDSPVEVITESSVDKEILHTVVHRGWGGARGLAVLVEQIPARTHAADVSDAILTERYWAVTGLPYFQDIANITGATRMRESYGQVFSDSESPRAVLFKRGFKNATSLDSIIKLMRQNNITAIYRGIDGHMTCNESLDCVVNKPGFTSVLGVRGDIAREFPKPYGIVDTKVITAHENGVVNFAAVSGPPFTKASRANQTTINRGNLASIYTDQFDDEPHIDTEKIRDMLRQQQEDAEQENIEFQNRDVIKPFQWSQSNFSSEARVGLPDVWNFGVYKPKWSW